METYQVLIKAFATVVVEAEDGDSALDIACSTIDMGELHLSSGEIEKTLKPNEMDSAKRHADLIIDL